MSVITKEFLKKKFPDMIKFAFLSDYITKSELKRRPNVMIF